MARNVLVDNDSLGLARGTAPIHLALSIGSDVFMTVQRACTVPGNSASDAKGATSQQFQ